MKENILDVLEQTWWEKLLGKITVAYIDTEDYFLDREFTNYKVRAQFFSKVNSRYYLRVLRIPKIRLDEFKVATSLVRNKALICGYPEFDTVYKRAKELIDE